MTHKWKRMLCIGAAALVLGGNLPHTPGILSDFSLTASAASEYGITVMEKEVSAENAADIFGDGTCSYSAKSNTLTINRDIEGTIRIGNADSLTVRFVGDHTFTAKSDIIYIGNSKDVVLESSEGTTTIIGTDGSGWRGAVHTYNSSFTMRGKFEIRMAGVTRSTDGTYGIRMEYGKLTFDAADVHILADPDHEINFWSIQGIDFKNRVPKEPIITKSEFVFKNTLLDGGNTPFEEEDYDYYDISYGAHDCHIEPYHISFDVNGGEGEMEPLALTYESAEVKLPASTFIAPTDKFFVGWDIGGETYPAGTAYTLTGNVTAKALWGDGYTVQFAANGGEGTMDSLSVKPSENKITLPECGFTAPHYTAFEGWMVNGDSENICQPGDELEITGNTFLTAAWKPTHWEVIFSANGGTGTMDPVFTPVNEDYIVPQCDFTAPVGKNFAGWKDGEKTYQPGEKIQITDTMILEALWAENYVVSFDADGGTGTMASVNVQPAENKIKLPKCGFTAPENCAFDGWKIGSKTYAAGAEYTVTANTSVKALWKHTYYNVSFDANGGTGTMAVVKAAVGSTYTLPANGFTAPTGKGFGGWEIADKTYQPGDKVDVTADLTLKAIWIDSVTVTFAACGGKGEMAAVSTSDFNYTLPKCAFTAPKNKQFAGWFINGEIKKSGEKITLTGDLTLYATWDAALNNVSFNANGAEGSIADVVLLSGSIFTFPTCTLTAPEGKKFAGWQIGDQTYQPLDTLTVSKDVTVKALWETIQCKVTFDANGGTGEMTAKTLLPNSELTLPKCAFTAPAGSEFIGWFVGKKNYEIGDTVIITEDTVILALWTEPVETILVGDVSGDGKVDQADATLLARYVAAWDDIELDLRAADLNNDGTVDNADAMILSRYAAGWADYDKYIVTKTV